MSYPGYDYDAYCEGQEEEAQCESDSHTAKAARLIDEAREALARVREIALDSGPAEEAMEHLGKATAAIGHIV